MDTPKKTILVVDDEEDLTLGLSQLLSQAGYEVYSAPDGPQALKKAKQIFPDLILLDLMLPHWDGRQVKERLSEDERLADIPVIFVTAKNAPDDKAEGIRMAEDYVTKPFETQELLARIEAALKRHHQLQMAAMTDALTGLGNQLLYEKQGMAFFNIARRYNRIFSLAVIDIDDLKGVNDRYGHQVGSAAIQLVAETMREVFRDADILIRYGGDEFAALCPESDLTQASTAVQRFRKKLAAKKISIKSVPEGISISVSVGVAAYSKDVKNLGNLFEKADQQMYLEKKNKSAR